MTDYALSTLRNDALTDLGVKDPRVALDSTLSQEADRRIKAMLAYLADEKLLTFDHTQSVSTKVIPANQYSALRKLAKYELSPGYRLPQDPGDMDLGMKMLRRSILSAQTDLPATPDYY